MNPLAKRRAKISPDEQRKAQEEVRRQIALAVSLAERRVQDQMQAEVLEALQQVTGN